MVHSNDKYPIFQHVIDSYINIAIKSGFKYGNKDNKYVISGYPSANFNFFYLSKVDDVFKAAVNENVPFACFPQRELENDFAKIAQDNALIMIDNVVAHRFDIDDNWLYNPSSSIRIEKVQNNEELILFDEISSECFAHSKGLAYDFLQKVAIGDEMYEFFVAYHDGMPIGTAMVSFTNNIAGIYWLSVLPNFRNYGVATALTNYIINSVKQKGYTNLISQNLTPSQSLFQRIGFKPQGALPLYINTGENSAAHQ